MLPVTTPGAEIVFEGTCNFRELGGYRAADGRHVRRGLLYRGCSLDTLQSPADRTKLESLHLREILDLRSAGEAARQPDVAVSGAHYQRICGMRYADGSEMDFSPAGIQRIAAEKAAYEAKAGHPVHDFYWFTDLYKQMPFGNPAYHELFRLLEEHRVPLLFHCTCGKDRTGILAALILGVCGASTEDIAADYSVSQLYLRPMYRWMRENIPDFAARAENAPFFSTAGENILAVCEHLEREYGGAVRFLRECGAGADTLDALRRRMIKKA